MVGRRSGKLALLGAVVLASTWVSPSAEAATAGQVSAAGSTLYTGATTSIGITPGDETGSFVVDLYKSTTLVARVATGTDITAVSSVKWVIPTSMKLEGTGYKFVVDTPSGSPFETASTFDITRSVITAVELFAAGANVAEDDPITTAPARGKVLLSWSSLGASGESVAITMSSGSGKVLKVAAETENDGSELVSLPLTGVTVGAEYTLKVTPLSKTADGASSSAITVTAATAPTVTLSSGSATLGATVAVTLGNMADGGTASLDLVGPTGKVVTTFAKSQVASVYNLSLADAKVVKAGVGAYKVRATLDAAKTVTTEAALTVTAFGAISFGSTTTSVLSTGVVYGQIVPVTISIVGGADLPVTLQLASGKKKIVLDKAFAIAGGSRTYSWLVTDKIPAGTWTITATNNLVKSPAVTVTSAAFTVGANPTVRAADIASDPTTAGSAATSGASIAAASSTLYVGQRTTITVAKGNATGAYAIDLYRGSTRVARVASGSDISGVGTVVWVIPSTMSLPATGYKFVVDTSDNAPFETASTFAIENSGIGGLTWGYDTPIFWVDQPFYFGLVRTSSLYKIRWGSSGTIGTLTYQLLASGSTKPIVIATGVDDAGWMWPAFDRSDIPAGTYTLRIVPQNPAAQVGEHSITFSGPPRGGVDRLEAGDEARPLTSLPMSHFKEQGFTTQLGRTLEIVSPDNPTNRRFDLVLIDPSTSKVVAKLASQYRSIRPDMMGMGDSTWPNPVRLQLSDGKLKAGTYTVRSNYSDAKKETTDFTLVVEGWVAPTVNSTTATALAAGVTHGQTVRIQWTAGSGATFPTSITASNGSKTFEIDKTEMTTAGAGSLSWTVSDKLPAGSAWKLTIANAVKGASSTVDTATFAIAANPTTLAKNIPS